MYFFSTHLRLNMLEINEEVTKRDRKEIIRSGSVMLSYVALSETTLNRYIYRYIDMTENSKCSVILGVVVIRVSVLYYFHIGYICITYIQRNDRKWNKNVDIKFSAHSVFLENPSSGTLKIERLEGNIICNIIACFS